MGQQSNSLSKGMILLNEMEAEKKNFEILVDNSDN